jgi:hypothetical protein
LRTTTHGAPTYSELMVTEVSSSARVKLTEASGGVTLSSRVKPSRSRKAKAWREATKNSA